MSDLKISLTKIKAMEIADGLKNQIRSSLNMTSEDEEKFFSDRASVCSGCLHRDGSRCGICNCIISVKTKSFESDCPKGLWSEIKFNNEILGYDN